MRKRKISLYLNIILIILEMIGFWFTIKKNGRLGIEYYTEDSNILATITSILFVGYLLFKKKIPYFLKLLKYFSVIGLTITFIVVLFILAPMYNFNYGFMLFHDELLFHHLLCPLLAIILFLFIDDLEVYSLKDNLLSLSITILYGTILVILNIVKVVDGPYPFLQINNQSIILSILWGLIIITLAYIIAFLLRKMHVYYYRHRE